MNRHFVSAAPLFLAVGLWQSGALAQPRNTPTPSTYSLAELERFLGGRTLVTLDLKDATIEEVAAAMKQSTGLKIAARSRIGATHQVQNTPVRPAPLFTLSADKTPFWETLRGWQTAALEALETGKVSRLGEPVNTSVPNSLGVMKANSFMEKDRKEDFTLTPSDTLVDGRAVSAWPFLLVGTDLRRGQEGRLSQTGLRELEVRRSMLARPISPKTPATKVPATIAALPPTPEATTSQAPTPEEKRWKEELVLTTYAYPDPKLNPIGLRCEVVEAVDDKGNDLRLNYTPSPFEESSSRMVSSPYRTFGGGEPLQIRLASKPGMGKRLVRLRGVLHFSAITRVKHWETTQLQTPVADTIQQEGGEFQVQFKGVNPNGRGWTVDFAAQSQGTHLKEFWERRQDNRTVGMSTSGGNVTTGLLNFEGVPKMRLIDENGVDFEMGNNLLNGGGSGSIQLLHTTPQTGVTEPFLIPLDRSPVPPDVAQNWKFTEEEKFGFGPAFDWAPNLGIVMGRPAKIIVDFPVERRYISVPFEFSDLPLPPS